LIKTVVSDVQQKVCKHHDKVKHVEKQYVPLLSDLSHIGLIDELGGDTEYVTDKDQKQEK
jgi:hypothetical protein